MAADFFGTCVWRRISSLNCGGPVTRRAAGFDHAGGNRCIVKQELSLVKVLVILAVVAEVFTEFAGAAIRLAFCADVGCLVVAGWAAGGAQVVDFIIVVALTAFLYLGWHHKGTVEACVHSHSKRNCGVRVVRAVGRAACSAQSGVGDFTVHWLLFGPEHLMHAWLQRVHTPKPRLSSL